jgi:two-component system, OmpR family, phosphate regulon sensor histidine kinase PhoR
MISDMTTRLFSALAIVCVGVAIAAFAGANGLELLAIAGGGVAVIVVILKGFGETATLAPPPVARGLDHGELLDAVADPVLVLTESRIDYANKAALSLLGPHILYQDVRTALRHPVISDLISQEDGAGKAEVSGIGDAGQIWEVRVEPAQTGTRLVHLIDRTARHAAERARVDFVANASHELRTPLATLLGYIETLRDEGAGGDEDTRNRFLSIMDAEAKRMQRLVSDLMSLSRIEAEKHALPEYDVDLASLIARVSGERPDALVLRVKPELPAIRGDAVQLSQLLHNLIDNAVKYGRSDKPVEVSLESEVDDRVTLSVRDHGEGIAPEHLPRLTERFYRVDPGRSRSAGGTGLGLSIVKHIVAHHRGVLKIDSVVGEGTCVSVSFPASSGGVVT